MSHWGKVYWSGSKEDEVDPIQVMIDQVEELKNSPIEWNDDETMEDAEKRFNAIINELEHKISDAIYFKTMKTMGS